MNREAILKEIDREVRSQRILLYTKGTKAQPMCGFSAATIELFKKIGKPFETIDVLANPDRREWVPKYSQWPTFPQVFIGGRFIGGCDIIHEMYEQGELLPLIEKVFQGESPNS